MLLWVLKGLLPLFSLCALAKVGEKTKLERAQITLNDCLACRYGWRWWNYCFITCLEIALSHQIQLEFNAAVLFLSTVIWSNYVLFFSRSLALFNFSCLGQNHLAMGTHFYLPGVWVLFLDSRLNFEFI